MNINGRYGLLSAFVVGVLVVAAVLVKVTVFGSGPLASPAAAGVWTPPPDPEKGAQATVDGMAAALLRGDESGWLAGVDAPAQPFFRNRFRSLRALGVSQFRFRLSWADADLTGSEFNQTVDSVYCFSLATCPSDSSAPTIAEEFTFRLVGDRWLIGAAPAARSPAGDRPVPWERGDLVFAQGKRVTVAAASSVSSHFKTVVAAADQAAAVADRFATMVGNPQRRYLIYLAGPAEWSRWFGGEPDKYATGYEKSLGTTETDVVLKIKSIRPADLRDTLQHEMGHVVTLGGVEDTGDADWETEGIAEYIGQWPRAVTRSGRIYGVRDALSGAHRPASIELPPLKDDSPARDVDSFYGLSYFAMACMADRYGEPHMIDFVKRTLRQNQSFDDASTAAFGRPFDAVDHGCVDWIRRVA